MKTYTKKELYASSDLRGDYKGYQINYHGYFDAYFAEKDGKIIWDSERKTSDKVRSYIDDIL